MSDDVDPAEVAQQAALDLILSRYDPDEIDDLDVTTSFTDGELSVEAYVHVAGEDTSAVVTDAIDAAVAAVDELFDEH